MRHRGAITKLTLLLGISLLPVVPGCAGNAQEPDREAAREVEKVPELFMGQVTLPSGREFLVSLAVTPEEQARGYMYQNHIPPDEGMLFVYEEAAVSNFWMKNTLVSLDIIWLDRENRVVAIEHSAQPCKEDPCPLYGPRIPTFSVLEVRGGIASEEGLETGDRLQIVTDLQSR